MAAVALIVVLAASLTVAAEVGGGGARADAAAGVTPAFYLDASNSSSYSGSGTAWTDLSGNGRHGTISGSGITFNATSKALEFPGGSNGTAWVALSGTFADFSNGVTIEFEGEFGATRAPWERIFDFAAGVGSTADAFWVGQMSNTNELALEVWNGGVSEGYCTTSTSGTALGPLGTRTFAKWVVTLGDVSGTTKCRMYKDGVELATQYRFSNTVPSGAPSANGVDYALPDVTARPSALLGRSNFVADADLEGSIRYIRLYEQALTPSQVGENATGTVTFDANGGTGTMAAQTSTVATTLTSNAFTAAGRSFAGWNTSANGSGTSYANGATYSFSADVTLYAQWQATVTFDANGGAGSMSAQTSTVAAALSSNTFTRAGRVFAGWNTSADGSGTAYANAASYSFAASTTLYAQWQATVTFNANGGAGSMSAQTSTVAAALSSNTFTRAGRGFAGWNTSADGSGTAYADGATYAFTASTTLYAQWNATVTFDANGGTGSMAAQTSTAAAALSSNAFTRVGRSFAGWNTSADGSGTTYADGATYSFAAAVTLFAQWQATVTFDANGGAGSMAAQTSTVATALSSNAFTRVGRSFAGWNTSADGSGTTYVDGATYSFAASTTLYAQWQATVTFDANGGSGSMAAQTSTVAAALTANAFTRVGRGFAGWNTSADGSGTAYADGATHSFAADATLYAQWQATVTFDANGGTGSMAAQTSTVAAALTSNGFTRVGRGFAGWNTSADGSGTAYADAATFPFTSSPTLYAQWDATVTFDANGGTGSMAAQTSTVAAALTTNAFTRTGRSFAGWNTSADGSGTAYADTASFPFTASVTLYAQWQATVTFDANGGSGTMAAQTSMAAAALSSNVFTRTGRTFAGWNTSADGSGTAYADGATFAFGSNATLYAQWSVTVTFDANGGTGTMAAQTSTVAAALTTNAFTWTGRSFVGWNTSAAGSGTAYSDGATVPFTASMTLYAQWDVTPAGFVPVATSRLYDSRDVDGPVDGEGQVREIDVAGLNGVPADATVVVLNVTATGSVADGFVTVYPCGEPRPSVPTLWFAAGEDVAQSAVITLTNGKVCLHSTATTDIVLDVNGAYGPSGGASLLETVNPFRVLDSRLDGTKLEPATPVEVTVTDAPGVPGDASAVLLNVTVTEPEALGFVAVYACGVSVPLVSNLNFGAGETVPNLVTVQVGVGGKVCLVSSVPTHLVVDVNAALSPTGVAAFSPQTPTWRLDADSAIRLTAGVPVEVVMAGEAGVANDAVAVTMNVTAVSPAERGFVTVFPCGTTVPVASNLNFVAGESASNTVTAALVDGKVCFYANVDTDLTIDVRGQYLPAI